MQESREKREHREEEREKRAETREKILSRVGDPPHGIEASQIHDDKEKREERKEKREDSRQQTADSRQTPTGRQRSSNEGA